MGKPGRPRKNGVKEPQVLSRVAKISWFYNEARRAGMKHSSAVRETVESIRKSNPEMPISETEVQRVLAEIQSEESPMALLFELDRLQGAAAEEARKRVSSVIGEGERLKAAMQKSSSGDSTKKQALPPALTGDGPLNCYRIQFGRRPSYPRNNAKVPPK